jgi:peptidoglycan/xylan/chitin deacetylase (PgdA/CDA1 family)
MRSRVRTVVAGAIRWSGLAAVVRNTWARRRASIVIYHDPPPALLEEHLRYLAPRYGLTTLSAVVDALRSGDWSRLPPKPLVVTIDDGHAGNARLTDVLRRHGLVPTIFLTSAIVGTERSFWFEGLDAPTAAALKLVPNAERLAAVEDLAPAAGGRRQALSAAEIEALRGACEFGSHTRFHPILPMCTDAEAEAEIAGSKSEVEALAGAPCRHFAYPNGAYTERDVRLARDAGFDSARTVDVGWVGRRTDPHRLPTLSVADDVSVTELAAELAGFKWLSRVVRREATLGGRFRLGPPSRWPATRTARR